MTFSKRDWGEMLRKQVRQRTGTSRPVSFSAHADFDVNGDEEPRPHLPRRERNLREHAGRPRSA